MVKQTRANPWNHAWLTQIATGNITNGQYPAIWVNKVWFGFSFYISRFKYLSFIHFHVATYFQNWKQTRSDVKIGQDKATSRWSRSTCIRRKNIGIAISFSESTRPLSLSVGYCSNDSMDYKIVTGRHDSRPLAWLECCHKWRHSLPLFQKHRTVSMQRIRRCREIELLI